MTRAQLQAALASRNLQAFLQVIRSGEGTLGADGYRTLFGGSKFTDFSRHPAQPVTRTLGGKPVTSTAAGAYQFLAKTWAGLVAQYGFPDFSPACQDEGAVALIAGRGALADVLNGKLEDALAKCNKEWASLPGSPYGQPTMDLATAWKIYTHFDGQQQPAPVEEITLPKEEPAMAPFIAAALPALLDAAPNLIRLFGASPQAEKNAQAAEAVVQIAKTVTQEPTAEAAVQKIQDDPAAAEAFRQAAYARYLELSSLSEKSVAAAREFAAGYATRPRNWPLEIVTYAILFMVASVMYITLLRPGYSENIQVLVIQAVVGLGLSAAGFWLGSSYGSQKRDDRPRAG